MIKLKSKMFDESAKSLASENLFSLIITFIIVFLLIVLAESVIPFFMSYPDIKQELYEQGYLTGEKEMTMKVVNDISKSVGMQTKYLIPTLFCTVFGTLISIFHCRNFEGRKYISMGMNREKAVPHYFLGLGIGLLLMTLILLLTIVTGSEQLSICKEIKPGIIALFLGGFLIQGMSEEFIFRGYLMITIGGKVSPLPGLIVSSVFFSLAHAANPGFGPLVFFNLALFGGFAGLYIICTGDIWGACAIHSIWNFTQGNIYGISVSGTGDVESIFRTTAISGSKILTGGDFGIEGSIFTTLILLAAIGLVLLKMRRSQLKESA